MESRGWESGERGKIGLLIGSESGRTIRARSILVSSTGNTKYNPEADDHADTVLMSI